MFTNRFDNLYKNSESANKALSVLDIVSGAKTQPVKNLRHLRRYSNPDLFYLDKTAGIMPLNSYIDGSGHVYYVCA